MMKEKEKRLPYSLPDMRWLREEKDILISISERMVKTRKKLLREDSRAIGEDWANVGRDIERSCFEYEMSKKNDKSGRNGFWRK